MAEEDDATEVIVKSMSGFIRQVWVERKTAESNANGSKAPPGSPPMIDMTSRPAGFVPPPTRTPKSDPQAGDLPTDLRLSEIADAASVEVSPVPPPAPSLPTPADASVQSAEPRPSGGLPTYNPYARDDEVQVWYQLTQDSERIGPVTISEFKALFQKGEVDADTLIFSAEDAQSAVMGGDDSEGLSLRQMSTLFYETTGETRAEAGVLSADEEAPATKSDPTVEPATEVVSSPADDAAQTAAPVQSGLPKLQDSDDVSPAAEATLTKVDTGGPSDSKDGASANVTDTSPAASTAVASSPSTEAGSSSPNQSTPAKSTTAPQTSAAAASESAKPAPSTSPAAASETAQPPPAESGGCCLIL